MGKPAQKHVVSLLLYFGEKAFCSCHGGDGLLYLILCDVSVSNVWLIQRNIFNHLC